MSCEHVLSMRDGKIVSPKKAAVLKKKLKKKPVVRAIVFTYERGKESTSSIPSRSRKLQK